MSALALGILVRGGVPVRECPVFKLRLGEGENLLEARPL